MRRQHIDQRTEPDAPRALGDRRQKDAGRTCNIERRRVMLAHVIGAEAGAVVELDQREPLLVLLSERIRATVVLIEDAELHPSPLPAAYSAACATGLPISPSMRAHSAR